MFNLTTRILVIDDMLTMRKIVMKACRELGFTNMSEAADGQKGWEVLTTTDPGIGLIISDWNMPNCSGLDLLKRVRADGRLKGLPFLLLTAESEGHQVAEAVKSGVDNYVIKPFTMDILKTKLQETHVRLVAAGRAAA
jgi:two-component system chemotaxis response regulator CheY